MSYRVRVLESYRQSLLSYGYSEKMIKGFLIAFQTGYDCGLLHNSNEDKQQRMENSLLYETEVM
jgi:hypothetical protein